MRNSEAVFEMAAWRCWGRLALAFAVIGALAGLAAAVMSLASGSAATPPTVAPVAVVAPATAPTTQSSPATAVATKAPAAAVVAPEQVIVAEGDSLSRIAIRKGVAVEAMIATNPQLSDPMRLYPGDTVNLPKAAAAPAE